jgi:tetratricopeptide (TPR) repeat protein
MRTRIKILAVILLCLTLAGTLTRFTLEERLWQVARAEQPELQLESLDVAMGQGILLGLLGGFRALVANALWLRAAFSWENTDLPQTQTFLRLVVTVDPRPIFFWQNGSRIIAYDMPNWRITARGGYELVPETVQRQIDAEQARIGIQMLERGLEFHPNNPLLLVEIANIHQRRLRDVETAAEFYKLAAEQPDAPFYAARIHAELLRELGRRQEAYQYLLRLLPTLPRDIPFAMPWVVYDRIRELEEELNIPAEQRYQGTRPSPLF